jgi:hypothetical protein
MSTRCTISYDTNDYHLYEECFDSDNVYLSLDGGDWAASLASANVDWRKDEPQDRPSLSIRMDVKLWRKIVEGWLASDWAAHPERDHVKREIDLDFINSLLPKAKGHDSNE